MFWREQLHKWLAEYGRHFGLTEDDYLVLPMDVCQFDEHQKCVDAVIKKFGKVSSTFGRSKNQDNGLFLLSSSRLAP